MKKPLRFLVPIIGILVAGGLWGVFLNNHHDPTPLIISGNIEVTDVRMGFQIPGRLEQRLVDEGDRVEKARLLATLEKTDQQLSAAAAEANLAYAKAVLTELETGSRPEEIDRAQANVLQARSVLAELSNGSRKQEIGSAKAEQERVSAMVKTADVQLGQAKADFDRFEALFNEGGVSQREFELYRTRYDSAYNSHTEALSSLKTAQETLSLRVEGPRAEQISKARAVLRQAEAEYAIVKTGPRAEHIQQAAARVKAAEETFNQATQQIGYTDLFSPMAGVVLSKSAEPGEYLTPGTPVVTIGDIRHPWLRAYIHEKDLGKIKLGDAAAVTTDAFPKKSFMGRVSFISSQAEFTPKSVQTFEERVKLMFRIKIEIDNPNEALKPGMPADAVISAPPSSDRALSR